MENEPLDYFNLKKESPYTRRSYRKFILVMILMGIFGLILFALFFMGNAPSSAYSILIYIGIILFLAIPFFSFWGAVNVFQSYESNEENTTKRTLLLIFHVILLAVYAYFAYRIYNLIPLFG